MKFIMLINVKLPINVDILTFISMINTTSESLKARSVFLFSISVYGAADIPCSAELSMNKVLSLRDKYKTNSSRYNCIRLFEPQNEISNNVVCATSKGSDQPAHMRSLIRAFTSRLNIP